VKVGKALATELSGGGYLEDPTASIAAMGAVRKRLLDLGIKVPLASNVAVTSFGDIPASVAADAVQIILCDHHYWGGMRQVQHLAKLAETFGIGLSIAFKQPPWNFTYGDGSCGSSYSSSHICMRYTLSLAIRKRRGSSWRKGEN
jgi:L-alanine-DL-glutamate epimerase-like enolase superfamily enzyme